MLILLIILLILFAAGGIGWPAYSGQPYGSPISLIIWIIVIMLLLSLFVGPWHTSIW
jgi:hypothetical protein